MKTVGPILVLSGVLNVAGLAYLLLRQSAPAAPVVAAASRGPGGSSSGASVEAKPNAETFVITPPSAGDLRLPPAKWTELMEGDLRELVERLRAAGIPRDQFQVVIGALVRDRFADEYRKAYGITGDIPKFWEAPVAAVSPDPAMRQAQERVNTAIVDMVRDLLGPDFHAASFTPGGRETATGSYGPISDDKLLQLLTLITDFSRTQSRISFASTFGAVTPEDRQKLDDARKEHRAAIEALLSPTELEEYDWRNGTVASAVRSQLVNFDPSEEEYKLVYAMRKTWEDQNPAPVNPTAVETRERNARLAEYQKEIAAALSPERGAEYLAAVEVGTQAVGRLARRLGLPPKAAADVIAIQRDIQARLAGRGTAPNSADDPEVAALGDEAARRIAAILGREGTEGYKLGGGTWLTNITTRSSRPAATPAASSP